MKILEQSNTKLIIKRNDFLSAFFLINSLIMSLTGWFALAISWVSFNALNSKQMVSVSYESIIIAALIGIGCSIAALLFFMGALFNAPYTRIFTFDKDRCLFSVKSKSLIGLDRQFLSRKLPKPLNSLLIGDTIIEYPLSEVVEARHIIQVSANGKMDRVSIILKSNNDIHITELSGGTLAAGKEEIAEFINNFLKN